MTPISLPRRRARLSAFALVLAAAAVFTAAAPAAAHDELIGTEPAAGVTAEVAPAEIVLTYSAEILPEGAEVQVTDDAGASVAEGEPVVAGTTLTQALTPDASGALTVLWRVVSSDGHPISGEYGFAIAAAEPTAEPTEASAEPSESASPTPVGTTGPEETPADEVETAPVDVFPWAIGAVVVAGVIAVVVYLLVIRPRRRGEGVGGTGSTGNN